MISMNKIFSKNLLSFILIIVMIISLYIYMNKKEEFSIGSQNSTAEPIPTLMPNINDCVDNDIDLAQYLSIFNKEVMTCAEQVSNFPDDCEDISTICRYSCNLNECKYDILEEPIVCEINASDDDDSFVSILISNEQEPMSCSEAVSTLGADQICGQFGEYCKSSCNLEACAEVNSSLLINPLETNTILNDDVLQYLKLPTQYCSEHDEWFRDKSGDQNVSCRKGYDRGLQVCK